MHIASGRYAGGSLNADYHLTNYEEPYPMNVDLHFTGISLEKLFEDWGMKSTGLRGAASGELAYGWEKDRILDGSGSGRATLKPGTVAFGTAKYPMALSGASKFSLARGVITFAPSQLMTPHSTLGFSGRLGIEGLTASLAIKARSGDFSEFDRLAYNFAQSIGKEDVTLLGLGGTGTIDATVRGTLSEPDVVARVETSETSYSDVPMGSSIIDLTYSGTKSVLTFRNAEFHKDGADLFLQGTLGFPSTGASPRFDLSVRANDWLVQPVLKIVSLDLVVPGTATGSMTVSGTPDRGMVNFQNTIIRRAQDQQARLNGTVAWLPGQGNIALNLDVGTQSFPLQDLMSFLDVQGFPATGRLTGTLHVEGPKNALEGAGSIVIRGGAISGEPIDMASADIVFTQGNVRATNVSLAAPAGKITGEAEYNFEQETFSYMIEAPDLDLSKFKTLSMASSPITGRLTLSSTGAGTLKQPEIVLQGTLNDAVLNGTKVPAGNAPPQIYLAIRNGELVVRGSAFDALVVEGTGTVSPAGDLDGKVTVRIDDLSKIGPIIAPAAEVPVAGSVVAEFVLGGNTSSIEKIHIIGTVPTMNLSVSGQQFTMPEPIRFALQKGRVQIESFHLQHDSSTFAVTGFASLTGDKRINVDINGTIQAELLQLLMPESRAQGQITVAAGITGTTSAPVVNGSAELVNAQLKIPGFPQLIDQITGTVVFRGDRVELDSLRAQVGGGRVVAGGYLTLKGLTPESVRLTLQGQNVAIRYFDGIGIEGDFDLQLSGDADHSLLQGGVNIDRALYYKDFAVGSVIGKFIERRGLTPATPADWQNKIALRIHITANDTLAVKNNIAELTGSATLDVVGTLAKPNILGDVTLDEGGKVTFQDVTYRVTRGTVTFQNPFRIDPFLDVSAEARVQEYDLTVNLSGTLDRLTPTISSDPPVSDLTLLSLLGPSSIGRPSTGGLFANGFQTAGTSLLVQSLGGLIGKQIFPFVDSFRVDAGLEGSSTSEPTVTFEKQVDTKLRVIFSYNTGDHRKNTEIIEYQIRPEWLVQFTRDKEREYILEARFRRLYNGYWGSRNEEYAKVVSLDEGGPSVPLLFPQLPRTSPGTLMPASGGEPGAIVREVHFKADAEFDVTLLSDKVNVKVGNPLHIRDVQDSISSLYRTGDFRNIRVDSTPVADGVSLTFVLSLNYRINDISFEGADKEIADASKQLKLKTGAVLSLSAVDRDATSVEQVLHNGGYLQVTVDPETRFARAKNQAQVIFHVTLGPLAHVSTIRFEGELAPFHSADLEKKLKLKPGDVFHPRDARRDADRARNFLINKSYRKATVGLVSDAYDRSTSTVTLVYHVNVGPKVEITVQGVSRGAVKRLLPFKKGEGYSEDLIDRATDAIVNLYQGKGYFYAAVDTEEKTVGDKLVVNFLVKPGRLYKMEQVDFRGNTQVSDKKLRGITSSAPVSGIKRTILSLLRRPVGVTQETLSEDGDSILAYYQLHGFSQTTVGEAIVKPQADGRLSIVYPIQEGAQTLVTSVEVEADRNIRIKLPDLQLEPGQPLNPQLLTTDVAALQGAYADAGYVEVQVAPKVDMNAAKTAGKVTYSVLEGPKVLIDQVSVRGNFYTDRDVILRKVALETGEPFSYRKLLQAQQELYRLGTFRRADVTAEETGTSVGDRNVLVDVEEGRNLSIAGSIGWSNEAGGSVSTLISHRNLFGTGRYAGVQGRYSQRRQQYFFTYLEPFPFGANVPTQFTIFRESEQQQPEARIATFGTFVEASRVFKQKTRFALRYEYKLAKCVSGDLCTAATGGIPVPIEGVPREKQNIQISSVTPSFFWDTRDDPFNPRRGLISSASIEYAFPFRSAEANFLKLFTQAAFYYPVSERSDFVASTRVGLIDPLASSGPGSVVPFSERFVAGGENTHRAYALDELGIERQTLVCTVDVPDPLDPDRTIPAQIPCADGGKIVSVGGNAMVIGNLEYRFPIFGSLFGATFLDAGNVWKEISGANGIKFDQLRYGVGFGIRYLTPVGPIRLDLGYKINREPFESPFGWSISLGYPF
ncbi:MAG: outer membrane protein assembly factor BamA [Acidobacteriota bacterium]